MTDIRRAALACAAAAVLFAGCGGDDEGGGGEALSKKDLAAEANEICAKYAKEGNDLEEPENIGDPDQAQEFFAKAEDIAQRQEDDLGELTPADEVKEDYEALLAAQGRVTKLLGDLASAAGDEDAEKGQELLADLQPISDEVDKTATAVGAEDCAG